MDASTFDLYNALTEGRDPLSLSDVLERPRWYSDAACAEHPELPWVPERGVPMGTVARMKTICAGCPVQGECAAFAADYSEALHGIWGGMSGRERRRHRHSEAA